MERDDELRQQYDNTIISTHTLTWSVTLSSLSLIAADSDFNSHAHVERDINMACLTDLCKHFNSHAHVERDLRRLRNICPYPYFNSHAHVERDLTSPQSDILLSISTHTLTWSVTSILLNVL